MMRQDASARRSEQAGRAQHSRKRLQGGGRAEDPTRPLGLGQEPICDPEDDAVAYVLLRDALGDLNPQERSMVRLQLYEDLTRREIWAHLHGSRIQVSRMLSRGLAPLREKVSTGRHPPSSGGGATRSAGPA